MSKRNGGNPENGPFFDSTAPEGDAVVEALKRASQLLKQYPNSTIYVEGVQEVGPGGTLQPRSNDTPVSVTFKP